MCSGDVDSIRAILDTTSTMEVEVWSWDRSLSHNLREFADKTDRVHMKSLDDKV